MGIHAGLWGGKWPHHKDRFFGCQLGQCWANVEQFGSKLGPCSVIWWAMWGSMEVFGMKHSVEVHLGGT